MAVQILSYALLCLPFRVLFRMRIERKKLVLAERSYIIVSNHPSRLDSFFVCLSLPFNDALRLVPIRFLTADYYMRKWYLKPFLTFIGCISTKPKDGKVLDLLQEHLHKIETVYLFPGGQLERAGTKITPKVGAIYLEREVQSAHIIPVHISIPQPITVLNIVRRKIRVQVIFGKPFRHKRFKADLQPLANELYNKLKLNSNNI